MSRHTENRYAKRQEQDGTWTVYDVLSGEPAISGDTTMILVGLKDAIDLVKILNREYVQHPQGCKYKLDWSS
jgi:hypothetical protein